MGWKRQRKLTSGKGRTNRGEGQKNVLKINDNTAMKHSMFINQAYMLVRM